MIQQLPTETKDINGGFISVEQNDKTTYKAIPVTLLWNWYTIMTSAFATGTHDGTKSGQDVDEGSLDNHSKYLHKWQMIYSSKCTRTD